MSRHQVGVELAIRQQDARDAYGGAIEDFGLSIRIDPRNPEPRVELARARFSMAVWLAKMENQDCGEVLLQALADAEAGLRVVPASADLRVVRGDARFMLADRREGGERTALLRGALADFEAAGKIAPSVLPARARHIEHIRKQLGGP